MVKIGELLRKYGFKKLLPILPPGALTPQGIEGAMKRDVSKHWCTLQWCASIDILHMELNVMSVGIQPLS